MSPDFDKNALYDLVYQEAARLLEGVDDRIAALANLSALLKQRMGFFWVGFYFVRGERLVLGPFQGTPACVYLPKPHGVCWAAVLRGETVVVPDVHQFPGHIACDPNSRSEIVVPIRDRRGQIRAVLDVDSDTLAAFDETDARGLEKLATLLSDFFPSEGGQPTEG
ncbi:MAG: GAF domain-containing protein [candidate division KSB1 bacterium]|nr:GAF domain-containing protein [candidate division KSB1 bacterium]